MVEQASKSRAAKVEEADEEDFEVEPSNMEVAERARRLDQAVSAAGGPAAVATKSGMQLTTLARYRRGRDMKVSALTRLAEATNVSVDWLATGRGTMQGVDVMAGGIAIEAKRSGAMEGYVSIPHYEARASAGNGYLLPSERIISSVEVSEDWIRRELGRNPRDLGLQDCYGDSMAPTIQDGQALLVDFSIQSIRASRIYVLEILAGTVVKRVQMKMDGSLLIISDNPAYQPEMITPSERSPLRVLGEVVALIGPTRL